jgi:3-hydroxyacyl-CoA dehydrogenase
MDFVGLDVNLAATRALFDAFGYARFRPAPLQERLVGSARLGRKSGRGFYRYAPDGSVLEPDPELAPPRPRTGAGLDAAGIVGRITLAIVNEAFHALDDGVADAATIDRAVKLGAAHPVGPFERADSIGLEELAATLDALSAEDGDAFRPALGLLRAVRAASRTDAGSGSSRAAIHRSGPGRQGDIAGDLP